MAAIFSMARSAYLRVSGCPCAYPTRTCASGPTCAGSPLKRGALTQEYFCSPFQPVKSGSVSPFQGCSGFVALIVGVGHVFGDGLAEDRIGSGLEVPHAGEIAIRDVPAGKIELMALAVERKIGNREIILHAAADLEPVRIDRRDGADIRRNRPRWTNRTTSSKQAADHLQPIHAEGTIGCRDRWRSSRRRRSGSGCAASSTQNADDLQSLALIFERLQIMRESQQVDFGRELHRRMSPVAVGEDAELSAGSDGFHAVLRGLQFIAASCASRAKALRPSFDGRRRIGFGNLSERRPNRAPTNDRSARCDRAAHARSE